MPRSDDPEGPREPKRAPRELKQSSKGPTRELQESPRHQKTQMCRFLFIGVRGSSERDISSLRAFGPGGRQIWGVVCVSARAPFVVFGKPPAPPHT